MGRTAKKLSVDNFILNRKPYFLLLRLHICNRMDLFHLLIQIYRYFFQMDLSASDLAHIQNIIDQGQQMMRCFIDLFQTVFDPLRIIQIFLDDLHHTHDPVDRCADIVGHMGEKLTFGLIGPFRLFIGLLQFFLIFQQGADIFFLTSVYFPVTGCNTQYNDDPQYKCNIKYFILVEYIF